MSNKKSEYFDIKDFEPIDGNDNSNNDMDNNIQFDDEEEIEIKEKKKIFPFLFIKDLTELILFLVFLLLLSFTIYLGGKAIHAKNVQKQHVVADIVVPVLGDNSNSEISVDLSNMKKDQVKEYTFKISNSKNGIVNLDEVVYVLEFVPNNNVEFEILKDNTTLFLDADNQLKENKLVATEKQDDVYTVKIKAKKKVKNKELLTIRILS